MARTRSLTSQINFALSENFTEGMDKHAYKKENREMTNKIYSYTELHNLKDFGKNLSNFFKENDMQIRNVKDIKPEHLQTFLNAKAETCTQKTLDTYKSYINKLEEVLNSTYKSCNLDFRNTVVTPVAEMQASTERGVGAVISRTDLNKILSYAEENRSTSGDAVILQNVLGVRVEELVQIKISNINLNNNTILLDNCKGGKDLIRKFPDSVKNIIKENIENSKTDKLFDIKSSTINRYLNRVEDRLGIDRHSVHDIRRLIAQEHYDAYREEGYSKREALEKTSKWLNHVGPREQMITKSYIIIR